MKLYCVDSFDARVLVEPRRSRSRSARAARRATSRGSSTRSCRSSATTAAARQEIATVGCSLGAYHAVNFALKRADLFPLAICLSGNYDPATWHGWGERGEATYFNNPIDYVAHLDGDHLDWLRVAAQRAARRAARAMWEDTTGALDEHAAARRRCSRTKGIRYELDLWGHDVPHDWPSWRAQLAHHLPRFC